MNQALKKLIDILSLQKLETNIYQGENVDLGFKSVFGGQVLGQALMAASYTTQTDRMIHSLHAYFLRAGDTDEPIFYEVDLIRSGKSFSTRRVVAKQHGRAIFSMSASFHKKEVGLDHAATMPQNLADPNALISELDIAKSIKDKLPKPIQEKFIRERPIEIRPIDPIDLFAPSKKNAQKASWMKASDKLPDQPLLHAALLAYASDFGLISAALLPHGKSFIDPNIQLASLDHSMWFHRDFRMDEWLLYHMESPSASGSRGFNRGQIFSHDGRLIASTAQEGLMRQV